VKLHPAFGGRSADLRQALRVTIAVALAYAAYRLLGLQQGYWAVFTVIIVMQGSIAGTLGAAVDRLAGTVAGAVLGGAAAMLVPHTPAGTAIALVLVIAITSFAAAVRPQLRVAPITAAILLLSRPQGLTDFTFVLDRVIEIALGGFIGVLVSSTVFRAPSRELVIARMAIVLEQIADLLRAQADGLEQHHELALAADYAALRKALTTVEAALSDADRERASGLASHDFSPSIARTLWRVRNDVIQTIRTLDTPLDRSAAERLEAPVTAMLRSEADFTGRCATALRDHARIDRSGRDLRREEFDVAFRGLRESGLIRPMDFDAAGRVFGLAFTLDRLHRDLADLADRIDEVARQST
jgi:uncharacterized membrane protein YgaE (UPF0421/DUF939 family)